MVAIGVGDDKLASRGPVRRHPRAVLALAILILFTILSYADRMIITLLVDPIKGDLGVSDVQISLLTGVAFALCFGLASVPLGWLADRYSRRWVIYGGVTVWSLATAAGGIAHTFGEMFAARFFVGIGEAALAPAAFAMIPDLFPRQQVARATGILASAAALGGGMAIVGGGLLADIAHQAGNIIVPVVGAVRPWQTVFLAIGLPGIMLALLAFLLPSRGATAPEGRPSIGHSASIPKSSAERGAYRRWVVGNWQFLLGLSLGCSALAALAYGLTSWTPAYLSRAFGLDVRHVALTLGLVQMLCGLVGYIGGGVLIDWLDARGVPNAALRYLLGSATVAIIGAVGGFYLAGSPAVALAFIGLYHLAAPYNSPLVVALQKGTPDAFRGRVIALGTMIATLLGLLVGPTAIALFTERLYGDPAAVGAAVATAGLLFGSIALVALAFGYRARRSDG